MVAGFNQLPGGGRRLLEGLVSRRVSRWMTPHPNTARLPSMKNKKSSSSGLVLI